MTYRRLFLLKKCRTIFAGWERQHSECGECEGCESREGCDSSEESERKLNNVESI